MICDDATLAHLMKSAQAGDRQAYSTLLEESARWLRRYFARRIAPAQLDDLVQEVLLSIHRKRASYDPARPYLPWLAAVARYRWVDHLRKVYRNADVSEASDISCTEADQDVIATRISLARLLEQLPAAQAQAIELVRIEGYSIREASRISGLSEPLVKVNIHRGLKKLASMVEEAG
ncbi:MAG: sigma-70 family RNA polymerase sigma factor [Novosphingobium sp.]|nr:sigma-70 family RNA polymerase sigma factor [Novosphingobium sp.]